MSIKEYDVTSLKEYMECINELHTDNNILWYRGHANCEYKLEPTIYRNPYSWEKEKIFMNEFKAKAIRFISPKDDYFEWLFIMQHHGTPTRLLDWSENAMVAMAFASQYRRDEHKDKDAVVWCLNPLKFNENVRFNAYGEEPIPNICEAKELAQMYTENIRTKNPIAIYGPYNNERILAQKGVFTLFPTRSAFCIEDMETAGDYLFKIVIKKDYVKKIAEELYFLGVNELSLFPELSSISKEIIRKNQ